MDRSVENVGVVLNVENEEQIIPVSTALGVASTAIHQV